MNDLRPDTDEVVDALVGNHRRFLEFLERRVGDRATAEDILQAAFVRGVEHADEVRDPDKATAWFYRLLRNAVADHHRHRDVDRRAKQRIANTGLPESFERELENQVCRCVDDLIETIDPGYAELLRRIDLGEEPPAAVAADLGITANNLRVRLHRARKALRRQLERSCGTCAEHGCLDCTCAPDSSCHT
jgi:RNA polymerase sigma-70 factor (ECF subfamily)